MRGDSSGGWFFLSLLTESFAVRALLGSVVAAMLAGVAVRLGAGHQPSVRRALVLAPVLSAALACLVVALVGEAYLPQLWFASEAGGTAGQLLQLLGELRAVSTAGPVDVLVAVYAAVAVALLSRRVLGVVAVRRVLRRARPAGSGRLDAPVARLAAAMECRPPRVLLLDGCPGGAFTTGLVRPVVVVDPALAARLDDRELEGLLAHELAHIARRDVWLATLVGVFRDLAFFVPPIHLALRHLRREQEESADAFASGHTGRPAALASGIVKAWDHGVGRSPVHACGVAAATRLGPRLAGVGPRARARRGGDVRRHSSLISTRVERLLDGPVERSRAARRAEAVVAAVVLALGGSAAVILPSWIAEDLGAHSLAFGYLAALPEATAVEESPALATFRALAPPTPIAGGPASGRRGGRPARSATNVCPCVETQAQLHAGTPAAASADRPRMLWGQSGYRAWQMGELRQQSSVARPLWRVREAGVFVVGRIPS